ncbi:hypothetical protein ABEX78_20730 [Priestia megaterium]
MNSLNAVSKEEYLDFELLFYGSVRNVISLFSKREGFNPDYVTEELVETTSRNVIKVISAVTNNQMNLNGYEVKKSINSLHISYLAEMLNEKAEKTFSSVYESELKLNLIDRIISFVICAQAGVLKPNLESISEFSNEFYLLKSNTLSGTKSVNFFDTTLYYLVCTFVARQGLDLAKVTKELIEGVGTTIIEDVLNFSKGKINLSQVRNSTLTNATLSKSDSLHLKCLEQIVRTEMNSYLSFRSNSYKSFSLIDRIIHLVNSLIFRTLEDPIEIIEEYGLDFFEKVTTNDVASYKITNT